MGAKNRKTKTDSSDAQIAIGKVRTSHGVRGYLKVESYSGETEHFTRLRRLRLSDGQRHESFVIEDIRATTAFLLVKLEGVDTPEQARTLTGWEIMVSRRDAAPLGVDEYYLGDLCKCDVVKEGRRLGKILSVCEGGGGDMLEVEVPSGRRHFVPFRKEFVGKVDIDGQVVEIVADWLLQ